jgi:hypothetical protein
MVMVLVVLDQPRGDFVGFRGGRPGRVRGALTLRVAAATPRRSGAKQQSRSKPLRPPDHRAPFPPG